MVLEMDALDPTIQVHLSETIRIIFLCLQHILQFFGLQITVMKRISSDLLYWEMFQEKDRVSQSLTRQTDQI